MKILGLDLSTKRTGWAFFDNNELVDYGMISCDHKDVRVRTLFIRDEIRRIIREKAIERVVLEELKVGFGHATSNFITVVRLSVLQGCVLSICSDEGTEFITYDPAAWRKLTKVNLKTVKCNTCGWSDEFVAGEDVKICPQCGEKRKTYLKTYFLNSRLELKEIAVKTVNERYGLKLEFYPRNTKKNISQDDIAEAILVAQAHINELNL